MSRPGLAAMILGASLGAFPAGAGSLGDASGETAFYPASRPDARWHLYGGLGYGAASGGYGAFLEEPVQYELRIAKSYRNGAWRLGGGLQFVYLVNAYANTVWNEIVFLAAIVRPPVFDPKADPAVNYGAMGAIVGHEISHLFDDQGRTSDGDGLLRDWWTPADAVRFTRVTQRLQDQVGAYEPLPGQKVDGAFTLGEKGDPDFVFFLDAWIRHYQDTGWLAEKRKYWFESFAWEDQL